MGRLFWKFLLAHWAALVTGLLGVGAALWLYQQLEAGEDALFHSGPRARFMVSSAAAIFEHGGEPALRKYLRRPDPEDPIPVYGLNEEGNDLLGRRVTPDMLERAYAVFEKDPSSEHVRHVVAKDGLELTLFLPNSTAHWFERILLRGGPPPSPLVPLAAGLIGSLVFSVFLAWYMTRPIRHLKEAFDAVSRGELQTRVAHLMGGRRDEVADLGRHFDRMTERVQGLVGAQQSLLHEVSHELRSPLARLQAAIGLARQRPDTVEGALERIENEASRVDALVGQLLTLSRLEAIVADRSGHHVEETDLMDLIASLAADADFEARTEDRNVVFTGEGEAVAEVRAELIHRAVENVVRNAVKYTRPRTTVEIRAQVTGRPGGKASRTRPASLHIQVADRGPGIDEGNLAKIFDPFFRADATQDFTGFGLGLAIARRALEAHGGSIHARNRDGGGLVVEMVLPLEGRPPNERQ